MSNIISEVKYIGHTIIDKQQVRDIIHYLPHNWEHMTYNKNIKMMEDAKHHLKLEEDHLEANKSKIDIYMVGFNSQNARGKKCKY